MVSKYKSEDKVFVNDVKEQLHQRTNININEQDGVAYIGGLDRDLIYPSVHISKDDIRKMTGRRIVRDVTLEKFKEDLNKDPSLRVEDIPEGLRVIVLPTKEKHKTEFPNLSSLKQANIQTMKEYENSRESDETDEDFDARNPLRSN